MSDAEPISLRRDNMKNVLLALGVTIFSVTPAGAHHNWAAIYDVDGDKTHYDELKSRMAALLASE